MEQVFLKDAQSIGNRKPYNPYTAPPHAACTARLSVRPDTFTRSVSGRACAWQNTKGRYQSPAKECSMLVTFDSLFDIYPDKLRKGAVVGYRKADGSMLEFPCTLETGDAVMDAKGRWTASSLGLKPVVVKYSDSLRRTKAREAWIGNGFGKSPDNMYIAVTPRLERIRFVDNVTEIDYRAFDNCWSLESITIPSSVTKIGHKAFINCIALTSVEIPESVTEIGVGAFYSCEGLTSVTIPSSVTSIGHYAFVHCTALTNVEIPKNVTEIGEGAFGECFDLISITIPESVISIGDWAFDECTSLTSVTIPESVTSIGSSAFYGCTSLTDIYVDQPQSDLLSNVILPAGCAIHWKQTEAV